jgi:hypothetical protein
MQVRISPKTNESHVRYLYASDGWKKYGNMTEIWKLSFFLLFLFAFLVLLCLLSFLCFHLLPRPPPFHFNRVFCNVFLFFLILFLSCPVILVHLLFFIFPLSLCCLFSPTHCDFSWTFSFPPYLWPLLSLFFSSWRYEAVADVKQKYCKQGP